MKKVYIVLFIFMFLIPIFLTGCDGFSPLMPEEIYDEENPVLEYLKVLPSSVEMTVNQSKKFEVKAYNSEDKLIKINISQLKWFAKKKECLVCVSWKLSTTQNSFQTTFTPLDTGSYEVWAKYEGTENKWSKADVEVN